MLVRELVEGQEIDQVLLVRDRSRASVVMLIAPRVCGRIRPVLAFA